jgi:phosphatidylinositol kinase/protein kinase (PI-3  family)
MKYFLEEIAPDVDGKFGFRNKFTNHDECNKHLRAYENRFMTSLAGQCVATYVIGVRDRHPSNFMF